MPYHSYRQRYPAEKGERDQDGDRAQGDCEVLPNHTPGALAEAEGGEEVLEPVMHQNYIGLFQGSIRTTRSHGDADVSGGQAWRIIHPIADHRDFLARV